MMMLAGMRPRAASDARSSCAACDRYRTPAGELAKTHHSAADAHPPSRCGRRCAFDERDRLFERRDIPFTMDARSRRRRH